MALDISVPAQELVLLTPKITVIGVGGAGGNAINNMIQSHLGGVNFVVANTDAQALNSSLAETKIQLGIETTKGHGAGARPEVGRESAEEAIDEISTALEGANMVFITAGMGGGTGTGAAPVVAKMARERDILTVGVVTKPFSFEGRHRMAIAEQGIDELSKYVDTLIVIPNQNLFLVADEKMTFAEAFKKADQVLQGGVRSITDLIITPGIINLDFSDVRAIMSEMGRAMMGTGVASGENRALDAAEEAIANPLLDDASMNGAKGILINIAGGADLTLFEVDAAANRIRQEVDPEANIIFGASFDESLEGSVRVSVVATGISRKQESQSVIASKPSVSSSIFSQTPAKTAFTPSYQIQRPSMTSSSVPTYSQPKNDMPEKNDDDDDDDILDIDDISVAPSSAPVHPDLTTQPVSFSARNAGTDTSAENISPISSILPAMPAPGELFSMGEAKTSVPFEAFTQKTALTEKPQPSVFTPDFPSNQEEKDESAAPQKDLFAAPAPSVSPVIPPPVKPVEKSRPSLFQFVTGRKSAEDKKADISDDDDSELPSFLRQR